MRYDQVNCWFTYFNPHVLIFPSFYWGNFGTIMGTWNSFLRGSFFLLGLVYSTIFISIIWRTWFLDNKFFQTFASSFRTYSWRSFFINTQLRRTLLITFYYSRNLLFSFSNNAFLVLIINLRFWVVFKIALDYMNY